MSHPSSAATKPSLSPWDGHAQKWSLVTSPLRPCAEDVALFQSQMTTNDATLLLGVTPELQNLSPNTCAIDSNAAMAAAFPASRFVCQTWQSLNPANVPMAPFDTILADGSLNVIAWPEDLNIVLQNVRELLKPNGSFICRFFLAPDVPETPEDVINLARSSAIPNFSAFKWHLAMALVAQGTSPNIQVSRIHDAFENLVPDRKVLAAQTGWPLEAIDVIDHYKNSATVYAFPTLAQVRAATAPWLTLQNVANGTYYLADRCPVVTFTRA